MERWHRTSDAARVILKLRKRPPYWPVYGGAHRGDHMTAAPPPPPGWYNDPSGARGQRYFDGTQWTDHRAATLSLEQRSELLDAAIFSYYRGARIESRSPTQAVLVLGGGVPGAMHVVFAILTFFTCGLFGIVWLIVAATSRERRTYISVDPYGQILFNGSPWSAPDRARATGVGRAAQGPSATSPSDKSFLARHLVAFIIGGVVLMAGGCVAVIAASNLANSPSNKPTTRAAAPTMSPDQKFRQDMDHAFDAKMNPGKNPITDIWNYRTFTDDIARSGHEICGYLGSHSYDETVQQFKLRLPSAYPTDSDGMEFVDLAIEDLCPEYSGNRHPGTGN